MAGGLLFDGVDGIRARAIITAGSILTQTTVSGRTGPEGFFPDNQPERKTLRGR
jgi:hypothetical protein